MNAVFHGPRREENSCGGLDTPSSSSSIGNGSGSLYGSGISTNGSILSQRSSSCGNTRKHIIQVSTYQMCVLMLFNKREKLTYEVSVNSSVYFLFLLHRAPNVSQLSIQYMKRCVGNSR